MAKKQARRTRATLRSLASPAHWRLWGRPLGYRVHAARPVWGGAGRHELASSPGRDGSLVTVLPYTPSPFASVCGRRRPPGRNFGPTCQYGGEAPAVRGSSDPARDRTEGLLRDEEETFGRPIGGVGDPRRAAAGQRGPACQYAGKGSVSPCRMSAVCV